jgi:alpha-glucosidase
MSLQPPWWQTAVAYQIYPRSFADANGDGVGDLAGIERHLDHLAWLGVGALWLSPFYRSPMKDFGYDVSDHCDVDPIFGSLADFDRLLAAAHARALRVIVDLVPNHTSDRHPWFVESRQGRSSAKRTWYVWRDPSPTGGPPNNWRAAFADRPAWTLDAATGQYYLHCFLPEQPDLDWSNPEVVAAMHGVIRFWLDRGVDGFRVDVVHLIGKDPRLADDPEAAKGLPHVVLNHRAETHGLLRDLRRLIDSYPGDRMMIGEVYLLDTRQVASYYGRSDELHLAFNFPPLYTRWDAGAWREQIRTTEAELEPLGAWPTWVLSNHDNPRHRSRYGGDEGRARAAAVLLLTLRGTPFLFAGEELGLEDAVVPPERAVDPGGRDGCRAPIPWEPAPPHGWSGAEPWLPWPPAAAERSTARLRDQPDSILCLYKATIALRNTTPALARGALRLLETPPGVLGFVRSHERREVVVLVNFGAEPVAVDAASGIVLLTSRATREPIGSAFSRRLAANEAVVIAAEPG